MLSYSYSCYFAVASLPVYCVCLQRERWDRRDRSSWSQCWMSASSASHRRRTRGLNYNGLHRAIQHSLLFNQK